MLVRESGLAIVVVAAAVAFVGCGDSLDIDKAEEEIGTGIEEQTGATGVTVTCPDDVELEAGGTFDCSATDSQGEEGTVSVEQTDDEGNIRWQLE